MKKTLKTKKKTRLERKTFINVLNFFNSAFIIVDSKNKICLANNNFENLAEYNFDEIKKESLEKYFTTEDLSDLFVMNNKAVDGEGVILSKSGKKIEVTFHAGAIKNHEGKEKLFVIHFTKSHKLKKHLNALNIAKEILKEKINTKDKELRGMNKHFEEVNKELAQTEKTLKIINDEMLAEEEKKSKYIQELTSQYKKPLEYINKVADILLNESGISDETRQQFIVNLENKAKSLQNSINFLYEWENEKIRGASSKIEETDISSFINEIEYYLEDKLNGKILKFDMPKDISCRILVDKRKLKDIFIDILKNAINYLLNDKITIKVIPNKQSFKIVFNIINSGIGVTDEYQLRLFDKYSYLRDVNFSPLELNFPVFNDILNSFASHLEVVKQKNKESIIKIEVPVSAHQVEEPVKAKKGKEEAPVKEKKEIKQEIAVKNKKPVVKKRKKVK